MQQLRGHAHANTFPLSPKLLKRAASVVPVLEKVFAPHASSGSHEAVDATEHAAAGGAGEDHCEDDSAPPKIGAHSDGGTTVNTQSGVNPAVAAPAASILSLAAYAEAECEHAGTGTALKGLNQEQLASVGMTLRRPEIAVLFGPPGTGKTTTLSALLAHLLASPSKPRVLILGQTNFAVEQMLTKTITRLNKAGLLQAESIAGTILRPVSAVRTPASAARQGGSRQAAILQQVCKAGDIDPDHLAKARLVASTVDLASTWLLRAAYAAGGYHQPDPDTCRGLDFDYIIVDEAS